MAVRVSYPNEALTLEEQKDPATNAIHVLYFYGNMENYEERMSKVWRPGATAQVFHYECSEGTAIVADRIPGCWLPFDAKLSEVVAEEHSQPNTKNRCRF